MTSRERVLRAMAFGVPDRVPRDLWALRWCDMFCPDEVASVRRAYPGDSQIVDGIIVPGDRASGTPYRKWTHVDSWGSLWASGEDGGTPFPGSLTQPHLESNCLSVNPGRKLAFNPGLPCEGGRGFLFYL